MLPACSLLFGGSSDYDYLRGGALLAINANTQRQTPITLHADFYTLCCILGAERRSGVMHIKGLAIGISATQTAKVRMFDRVGRPFRAGERSASPQRP
jgi:hypothetical protein